MRFLGTFLPNPTHVPPGVVIHVAEQIGTKNPVCLVRYQERPATHREHAGDIQSHYGYRDFGKQPEYFRFVRWLYTRAWISAERPSVLFDLATAWLAERKILLPGVTTLARLVGWHDWWPAFVIILPSACGRNSRLSPARLSVKSWKHFWLFPKETGRHLWIGFVAVLSV